MQLSIEKRRQGILEVLTIDSASLKDNITGEAKERSVRVYLPEGYMDSELRYPVLYWLHGFGSNDKVWMEDRGLKQLLDKAILSQKIKPMIVVAANQQTLLGGSFYTNSAVTGMWEDFFIKEIISFVDTRYRTLNTKLSRGLAGHSMGGNGAIRMAMKYTDLFGSVYAMSPAFLDLRDDADIISPNFRNAAAIRQYQDVYRNEYLRIAWAMAQAFSPNSLKLPFHADFPVIFHSGMLGINQETLDKWRSLLPVNMIQEYRVSLNALKAFKIDVGSYDEFRHIPPTVRSFSDRLRQYYIPHSFEQYSGGHLDKLLGEEGRIYNYVLPFFSRNFVQMGSNFM